LGIDAIWISPMYPSPLSISDTTFPITPPSIRSTARSADFDHLVSEAKKPTSAPSWILFPITRRTSHPWFKESRSSRSNPKRDWYIWRDGNAMGSSQQLAILVWPFGVEA